MIIALPRPAGDVEQKKADHQVGEKAQRRGKLTESRTEEYAEKKTIEEHQLEQVWGDRLHGGIRKSGKPFSSPDAETNDNTGAKNKDGGDTGVEKDKPGRKKAKDNRRASQKRDNHSIGKDANQCDLVKVGGGEGQSPQQRAP